jgi:hypothetical protein
VISARKRARPGCARRTRGRLSPARA